MSQVVELPSNSYKPISNTAWIRARLCELQKMSTRLAAASDKVYQLLAHDRWFSPGTSASSTTKTGGHDIAEILLKVKHQKSKSNHFIGCRLSPFIYLCCFGFISIFTICGCPTLFKHHPIVLAGKINMIFHRKPQNGAEMSSL